MSSLLRPPAVLALLLVALATVPLLAHLNVAKTSPVHQSTISTPPASVQVWFTQQPSPRISRLEVTGPGGDVELGELEIDGKDRSIRAPLRSRLTPGRYEVTWRTAGDDGHVQRGTFNFTLATE